MMPCSFRRTEDLLTTIERAPADTTPALAPRPLLTDGELTDLLALAADGTAGKERLAARLTERYPLTVTAFRQMPKEAPIPNLSPADEGRESEKSRKGTSWAESGLDHLAYVLGLEQRWRQVARGQVAPDVITNVPTRADLPNATEEYDLIYAGGVLGLFSAAVMAQHGYRVLCFDQRQVGTSHREWNISADELQTFVRLGLFTPDELETAIATRYSRGVVRFYGGSLPAHEKAAELWLDRVLDLAIDLDTLLRLARQKFEAAGGVVRDYRAFKRLWVNQQGTARVVVEMTHAGQTERIAARLLVNALGAISPLSLAMTGGTPFDGVCPTVGTTARGYAAGTDALAVEPDLGDVLVSVADAQRGRQLIWEGFPGKGDETTVYVFYYDLVQPDRANGQSLIDLFEDYFALLPTYKRSAADFAHLKPVYGYIPARHHRVQAAQRGGAAQRGVVSLGDANGQQSPLTFCGFGSSVRNLPRITTLLEYVLQHELVEGANLRHIGAHQANINMVWAFSRFMSPDGAANSVNRMMNAFCGTLAALPAPITRRFFQDRISFGRIQPRNADGGGALSACLSCRATGIRLAGIARLGGGLPDGGAQCGDCGSV